MTDVVIHVAIRVWPLATLALLAAVPGCSGSKGLVPVEGRVTFAGRQPPAPGYLYFVPREMSVDNRRDRVGSLSGSALFLKDGAFRAGTFAPGDGLRPGRYEVRIVCSTTEGKMKPIRDELHVVQAISMVPSGFVPPDLCVPPSGSRTLRFDIDVH